MRFLLWFAARYGKLMANWDWYHWHPWLGVNKVLTMTGPLFFITVLLLAQDAASPATAERIGKLEVRVGALESQFMNSETLHRADVKLFTKEQRDLRDLVIVGQTQTKIVWGVFGGILAFIGVASAWKTAWSKVRQWNGSLAEK